MKSNNISSSSLTGQNVYNLKDESIGDIKDLMIDPNNAEVLYAVLSFGGFMGIGNKLFAIPLEALQFSGNDDTIRLDINKEKLENAPSFDKDNWPKTGDNKFVDSVYNHYGIKNQRHSMAN
jgi:sporulation protein YlmC with PRC-barrel domain